MLILGPRNTRTTSIMTVYEPACQQLRCRTALRQSRSDPCRPDKAYYQQPPNYQRRTGIHFTELLQSAECRQLNLDARKAGRKVSTFCTRQGPPETNGGTNAPSVPLFREVPGQSRRLAFPCLHAIRRTSEKFMPCGPVQ